MIKLTAKRLLPLGIVVLGLLGLFLLKSLRSPPESLPEEKAPPLVRTQTVALQPFRIQVRSQGLTQAVSQTRLVSQVSGVVLDYNPAFNAGGMVKAGDLLVQIEQLDYQSALKTAQANLARARAAYEQELALAKVAAEEWRRAGREDSAPQLGLRKPQLAQEKANVLSAEAELERAERNLRRTTITAPYDAVVSERNVDIGQFISVGANVGELMATAVAEIRLPISLDEYQRLRTDEQTIAVSISANHNDKEHQWPAYLVRDEGIIDSTSRMLYLVAHVDDPYARTSEGNEVLRFGQFVQARLAGPAIDNVAKIKKTGLVNNQHVFIVDEESTLQKLAVSVVGEDTEHVYIRGPLSEGMQVVISGVKQALPGTEVKGIEHEAVTEAAGNQHGN